MKIVASSAINSDATKIKECIDTLSKDIIELQNYADGIPQLWNDENSKKFVNKYKTEVLPELRKYEQTFKDYHVFLTKVYEIFRTLDENYNKEISTE